MWSIALISFFCLRSSFVNGISPCGTSCPANTLAFYNLGYYWRDFFGVVPYDAYPGGSDESGNPTYIGQVYIREFELLPGTIYAGCNKIRTSAYDQELIRDKFIKILCSDVPHSHKWIPTKKGEHHLLPNCFICNEEGRSLNR